MLRMLFRHSVPLRAWCLVVALCAACAACAARPGAPVAPFTTTPAITQAAVSQAAASPFASQTPRASANTPPARPSATAARPSTTSGPPTATPRPASALALNPGNALSVTQAAVLGPLVLRGTRAIKLEQAAWSPTGQLAAAGAAGVLFSSGGTLTVTAGYTQSAWTLALDFSPDGRQLATGSVDGSARIFETGQGAELLRLAAPNPRVARVRFRPGPGGGLLATLGGDNQVSLWDVGRRVYLGRLDPGPGSAGALAFSGDGRWLTAAGQQTAQVWDVAALLKDAAPNLASPALSLALGANLTSVALSADGRRLAAGGLAGVIALWELPGGRPLGALRGVGAAATQLAFSPNGRLLASAHLDRTIRLWSTDNGGAAQPLATLTGHTDLITSLVFSPNGAKLASSSLDGTLRLWALSP